MARFEKGKSGNPSGRTKGYAAVAKLILKETGDGTELVHYALKIFRDGKEPSARRDMMHQWLSDRGLGRPIAMLDLAAEVQVGALVGSVDLTGMSDAAVDAIVEALSTALAEPEEPEPAQLTEGETDAVPGS